METPRQAGLLIMHYLFSGDQLCTYEVYLSRNTEPSKALHKATLSQYLLRTCQLLSQTISFLLAIVC